MRCRPNNRDYAKNKTISESSRVENPYICFPITHPSMFKRRVRIRLDGGPDQTVRPGQILRGTVEYKSPAEDRLSSLTIDFRGVSKVHDGINPKRNLAHPGREDQVELFHIRETLFQGNRTLEHHKSYTWPFDFVFPATTGPDRTGLYILADDDRFDEKPHHMPPSIGSDQAEHARVVYHMYAVAERGHRAYAGNVGFSEEPVVHNIENIRCMPDVLLETMQPTPASALEQTFRIFPPPQRTLAQKVQHVVAGSGPEASHTFKIVVNPPSMIILGKPIPVSFLVRNISGSSPDLSRSIPVCTYKTTLVALMSKTYKRCTKVSYDKPWVETKLKRLVTDHAVGGLPLDTSVQARKFPSDVVKDWPPSFKSYSISRSYDLQIDITVRFEGQKQDIVAHFEVLDITVIRPASEASRLDRRVTNEAPPPMPPSPPRDDDEELPPYEAAIRSR